MEAMILAGGLGTRLANRLNGLPKPMAPVAGRPFLEILLGQLAHFGCRRVMLSVGYRRDIIQTHFGPSFRGMSLDYVVEEAPLGTGGAIRKALPLASEDSILVLNGDTLLDLDYRSLLRFHSAEKALLTMAICHQDHIARYGGVLTEGARITGFEEKGRSGPGWINAGVYVIDKGIDWPPSLPESFSFERDFIAPEIGDLRAAAFPVIGFFLDIGIPEDLDRAQIELAQFHQE